ncbi:hypothetical protein FH972_024378 [Carpinus fangiana]|uniref:DNA topoisomerase (ATP-hydrolyzing) n=1 Tax=Carpinus fangiana TaxID=176857 RepID=A0A5N6KY91_9ROSI|nr:hypothetical protein FH972_024378 [Carpinus fangiana]
MEEEPLEHDSSLDAESRARTVQALSRINTIFHSIIENMLQNRALTIRLHRCRPMQTVASSSQNFSLDFHEGPPAHSVLKFPGRTAEDAWKFSQLHGLALSQPGAQVAQGCVAIHTDVNSSDMYYKDPALFGSQTLVDRIVDDIAHTFHLPRQALNVTAAAKGLVAGSLVIRRQDGSTVDCASDSEGTLICPVQYSDTYDLSTTKWVLVIEKEAVFRALASSEEVWTIVSREGLILTGKGYPDIATRALLHQISLASAHIPIHALVDYDPDGIAILSTYRHGSSSLAHEGLALVTPTLQWTGLRSADVDNVPDMLPLTLRDRRKAVSMLSWSRFGGDANPFSEERYELQKMLMLNAKAEIELLHAQPTQKKVRFNGVSNAPGGNNCTKLLMCTLITAVRANSHHAPAPYLDDKRACISQSSVQSPTMGRCSRPSPSAGCCRGGYIRNFATTNAIVPSASLDVVCCSSTELSGAFSVLLHEQRLARYRSRPLSNLDIYLKRIPPRTLSAPLVSEHDRPGEQSAPRPRHISAGGRGGTHHRPQSREGACVEVRPAHFAGAGRHVPVQRTRQDEPGQCEDAQGARPAGDAAHVGPAVQHDALHLLRALRAHRALPRHPGQEVRAGARAAAHDGHLWLHDAADDRGAELRRHDDAALVPRHGRVGLLPARHLLPDDLLPPRRACAPPGNLLRRAIHRGRVRRPAGLRRLPHQGIRDVSDVALPLRHRGQLHGGIRRICLLVLAALCGAGQIPDAGGEGAGVPAHAGRLVVGGQREVQPAQGRHDPEAPDVVGDSGDRGMSGRAVAEPGAFPAADHHAVGVQHGAHEPADCGAKRWRRGNAADSGVCVRSAARAVTVHRARLSLHAAGICRLRRRRRAHAAAGRILCLLHDDVGLVGAVRDPGRVLQYLPTERGTKVPDGTDYDSMLWRGGFCTDDSVGRVDDVGQCTQEQAAGSQIECKGREHADIGRGCSGTRIPMVPVDWYSNVTERLFTVTRQSRARLMGAGGTTGVERSDAASKRPEHVRDKSGAMHRRHRKALRCDRTSFSGQQKRSAVDRHPEEMMKAGVSNPGEAREFWGQLPPWPDRRRDELYPALGQHTAPAPTSCGEGESAGSQWSHVLVQNLARWRRLPAATRPCADQWGRKGAANCSTAAGFGGAVMSSRQADPCWRGRSIVPPSRVGKASRPRFPGGEGVMPAPSLSPPVVLNGLAAQFLLTHSPAASLLCCAGDNRPSPSSLSPPPSRPAVAAVAAASPTAPAARLAAPPSRCGLVDAAPHTLSPFPCLLRTCRKQPQLFRRSLVLCSPGPPKLTRTRTDPTMSPETRITSGLGQGMHPHMPQIDPYGSYASAHHMPPPMSPLSPTSARKRRVSDVTDPQGMQGPPSAGSMSAMSAGSFMDPGGFSGQTSGVGEAMSPPVVKKTRTNTPWTPAEEQKLKIMRDAGNSWSEIAKSFPSRTEGSVKKHWYKDMHYAEFAEDEVRSGATDTADGSSVLTWRQSAALLAAIKEYEASKWKVIGQKLGKPAKELFRPVSSMHGSISAAKYRQAAAASRHVWSGQVGNGRESTSAVWACRGDGFFFGGVLVALFFTAALAGGYHEERAKFVQ